jgi:hypothetical protein
MAPLFRPALLSLLTLLSVSSASCFADILLGDAKSFALLFEGAGGNTLQVTNVAVNGSIGVGGTGKMTDSGPSTINGGIYFSAANTGQFSNNNAADVITGGVHFSSTTSPFNVPGVLSTVNALNSTFGAKSGTNININGTMTINVSAGVSDGLGNRIFNVTSFNTTNNDLITIVGDAAHDNVIFNFTGSANFNNQVVLNGINDDSVLWNFVGGSNLTGGPTLQINTNASSHPTQFAHGIFLDPNGPISVTNANVLGRVFGGDTHDFQYVSGSLIDQPSTVPEPATFILAIMGLPFLGFWALRRRMTRA